MAGGEGLMTVRGVDVEFSRHGTGTAFGGWVVLCSSPWSGFSLKIL